MARSAGGGRWFTGPQLHCEAAEAPASRSNRSRGCRDSSHRTTAPASHIHIGAQRIVLDEFAARLDHVAHQLGEDVVGLVDLLDLDL
jgi:hypothetical protein